MLSVAKLPIFH